MRTNRVTMLNEIGVAKWLGIDTTDRLWTAPTWRTPHRP